MNSKEKKDKKPLKGMELIRDGIKFTEKLRAGVRCVCSPGGWSYGNVDPYHCACGCPFWPDGGGSSPEANNKANHLIAVPNE